MIEQLVKDLKSDEGFKDHVYDDATGKPITSGSIVEGWPTVGYGFCLDFSRGTPMPHRVAEYWLSLEVEGRWSELMDRIPWVVDQPKDVQRALCNMSYQLGVSGVLNFRRMIEALKRGDRAEAAREALDSRWSKQTTLRAQRIATLIRGEEREPETDT